MTSSEPRRVTNAGFGLYLHVPFCAAKCPYCDFHSGRDLSLMPAYVAALEDEIRTLRRVTPFAGQSVRGRTLGSVYFGGGTPGLLPPESLASLLNCVRESFRLAPGAEVTVEINPTLKEKDAFFIAAAESGVNRVSVGMQSAVGAELKALGRRGGPADVLSTVQAAKNAGIEDITVDIMIGIPGQTQTSLEESLAFALSLGITHLSVYILKIEEGTPFWRRRETLALPDEDAAADLYLFTCRYLKARGMRHYEISNFCFGGAVGSHNMNYWRGGEYLGLGPAAHSYADGKRFYFPRDTAAFLAGNAPVYDGPGGDADETLMLALRTDEGLSPDGWAARYGVTLTERFYALLDTYRRQGLLTVENGTLTLTDEGFLVSNSVISALLAAL